MSVLFFLINKRGDTSNPCELQKELFLQEITNGVVVDKVIEKENHAQKKIVILFEDRIYPVLFIPFDNWSDFEGINVGDTIFKPSKSFLFRINEVNKFELKFDCDYLK